MNSVTLGVHLQSLIIHTEMHEFTATSFVKEVFIPHNFVQEQEGLDSKVLSKERQRKYILGLHNTLSHLVSTGSGKHF
jgi:hypothetical protein